MNPNSYVNEPNYAPGTGHGMAFALALVILSYAAFFWLIFKGPLKHWSAENTGGAAMLLMFGPWIPIVSWILLR